MSGRSDGRVIKARDIMTADVATVRLHTRVREIAQLLLQRAISGVPVTVAGSVVGMVTAGDLVRRYEIGTDREVLPRAWWKRMFERSDAPSAYVKSHALRAVDVMTHDVVTVDEDATVSKIVDLFQRHRIRRVPVLRGFMLAGIVSRSDIVKAFVERPARAAAQPADDLVIYRHLDAELARQPWWRDESTMTVNRGTVHYWGVVYSGDERRAARVAAENVQGVVGVRDHRVHISELPTMV